jgi:hypothetical protein
MGDPKIPTAAAPTPHRDFDLSALGTQRLDSSGLGDPLADTAWGQPVAGNEQFPIAKTAGTADPLLPGTFVPRFIGFEEAEVLTPDIALHQPATRHEVTIRHFLLSLGLHLGLILSLFSGGTLPGTVVGPVLVELIFELPPDAGLPTQAAQPPPSSLVSEEVDGSMPRMGARQGVGVPPTKPIAPKRVLTTKPPATAKQPVSRASVLSQPARNEYLAYLIKHIGVLPSVVVGGRRGETTLGLSVRDNGTITRIVTTQTSGYPDIDLALEKMVAEIGHLPALGQEFRNAGMQQFELTLSFKFGTPLSP